MSEKKDYMLDLFVKEDRFERVKYYIEHVQKLFDVELKFTSSEGKQFMPGAGQWLDVEGQRRNVIRAREYVKGLSSPEEVVRFTFPEQVFEIICGKEGDKYYQLEQETAANIIFYSNQEIEISGSINAVTKASIVVEDIINEFVNNHAPPSLPEEYIEDSRVEERDSGIYLKCPLGTDCYHDNHSESSNINRSSVLTVDEDIEADSFPDTESYDLKSNKCENCSPRDSTDTEELMEFAKKLGYSESQVKSAIKKLGPNFVDQNELLHELIKASNSIRDNKLIGEDGSNSLKKLLDTASSLSTNSDNNSFLRHIVVDGSNVAMSHGNNKVFSCRGIAIVVNYFQQRGHGVTVFVPNWRKEQSTSTAPIIDQDILNRLDSEGVLSFTPSRRVDGKLIQSYDDRYIVRLAVATDGIIVSNDHFRDLQKDEPDWKDFINKRLLMYTFAGDIFMPPDDPLGRQGPILNDFLRKNAVETKRITQYCPYGKKCTFGPKCKFFHPERRYSGSFVKKPLPPLPNQHQTTGGGSRPLSDPSGRNVNFQGDLKQRPISLPNLEQLYISHPHSLHRYIYCQNQPNNHFNQSRPVSGPPFPPENNNTQPQYPLYPANCEQNLASRSAVDIISQQQQLQQKKYSGDFSHFNHTQFLVYTQRGRPPSGEFITMPSGHDAIGRPLSSDYGSRPSSGEFSYAGSCNGSRPASGEYGNNSRPSSGDYGSIQWGYQRQFPSHGNYYPTKKVYYKSRGGPTLPETKEEPRQLNSSLKIEIVEQLRQRFPDKYDHILRILRLYPEIRSVEDAIPYLNECVKAQ